MQVLGIGYGKASWSWHMTCYKKATHIKMNVICDLVNCETILSVLSHCICTKHLWHWYKITSCRCTASVVETQYISFEFQRMKISYLLLLVFVSHQSSLTAGEDYVVNNNYSAGEDYVVDFNHSSGEYYIVNQQNPQWAEVIIIRCNRNWYFTSVG